MKVCQSAADGGNVTIDDNEDRGSFGGGLETHLTFTLLALARGPCAVTRTLRAYLCFDKVEHSFYVRLLSGATMSTTKRRLMR